MGKRKEFNGIVTSDRMKKTVIVRVTLMDKHPKYNRIIRKYNKFKVHDEKDTAKVGDLVRIQETRPISKDKRYRLVRVIQQAVPQIEIKEEQIS